MRFKIMSKSMKALILASVVSIAAVRAAHATDGPGDPADNTSRSHASAAPNCEATGSVQTKGDDRLFRDRCRVLATEGAPGSPGDNNGRSQASNTTSGERHPILAASKPNSGGNINI